MKVALDLEEVLADTISEACNSTDKLDPADFEMWDLSDYTWQVYAGVSDALWRHDPLSIRRVEKQIGADTQRIKAKVDTLDIVTARLHVDSNISEWLDYHNVAYDEIVSTRTPKYRLDYDLYIDDNPEMFGNCRLLIRDHPHNWGIDAESSKSCDRIHYLHQTLDYL
jgi:5'(3')-deoxyribonucleotidase